MYIIIIIIINHAIYISKKHDVGTDIKLNDEANPKLWFNDVGQPFGFN